jgi:protein-tyrosine-phosphatase
MFLRNGDVPDPWYGDERDFEHVFALIRSGAEDIFRELEEMVPA